VGSVDIFANPQSSVNDPTFWCVGHKNNTAKHAGDERRAMRAKPREARAAAALPMPATLNVQTSFSSFSPDDENAELVDSRKAWTVVFGAFIVHFVVVALLYSFGIFVLPIAAEFNSDRGEVSLVGTMALVAFNFTGIFSGPISDKFGARRVIILGAICWTLGNVAGSFAQNIQESMFSQGILAGIGTAFVYWPTIAALPMWFDKLRATAVGFAVFGAGLGNLAYALGGQALISSMGWRRALLILGCAGGALLLIPIVLVERRLPPTRKITLFATPRELIHLRAYRFFLLASFFFQTAFFIPFIHLAAYTTDLGYSDEDAALAIAMLGIGSSVGRITVGPLADLFGRMFMFRLCMGCASVCMFLWPTATTLWQVYMVAFFYAYFGGGFSARCSRFPG